ncbi:hypothetical protein KSF78_0009463 [Schistosoma japonicum]|nr:hypothetical protein KSF78_0009463 [Schistosoma japonicum]
MVLLFLFYISVCIMAIQVSTQSVLLNANEKSIVELQRSVKELAVHNLNLSESTRRHLDLQNRTITGETQQFNNHKHIVTIVSNTLYAYYSDQCSFHSYILTGTQSNETEASCARLAPSNGYGNLKQIMIIFFITLNKYARYGILWHHV